MLFLPLIVYLSVEAIGYAVWFAVAIIEMSRIDDLDL